MRNKDIASHTLLNTTYHPAQAVIDTDIKNAAIRPMPVKKAALCRKLAQKRVCKLSSPNQVKTKHSRPIAIPAIRVVFVLFVKS